MDWDVLGPLLGGLGVGSAVSTSISSYLTSGQSRRTTRGKVLDALSEVEEARWLDPANLVQYSTFLTKCRALETAAMVARIPRDAVVQYLLYAHVARMRSQQNWEDHHQEDVGGFIEPEVDAFVREAASALTAVIWRPWLSRPLLKTRLKAARRSKYRRASDLNIRYQIDESRMHFGLPPEMFGHSRAKAPKT